MKKIVIDGRMASESGIGRYIRNLIVCLQTIDRENEYFILHLEKDFKNPDYNNNFHKVLADFRWYGFGEQLKLLRILKLIKPDLVHFPHFNVPVFYRGKFIVTIHDLIHQHFSMQRATRHGELVYKLKQWGYKQVFKNALKKSAKIITPSNFVKNQLIDDWKVQNGKIKVTYEAVDSKLIELASKTKPVDPQKIFRKFQVKSPFIFYAGNAHPHKNIEGLIRSFTKLKIKYPDLSLVLSGNDHYFWQRLKKENDQSGIIFTGYITDEELVCIYKNARCFVMPSLEEGFGIPLLEAMVCSCPVVSSNRGSLKEIGGDSALYFDPSNIDDMANKISQVLDNEGLRIQLIKMGLKRVKEFSWEKLARQTLEEYLQCV